MAFWKKRKKWKPTYDAEIVDKDGKRYIVDLKTSNKINEEQLAFYDLMEAGELDDDEDF